MKAVCISCTNHYQERILPVEKFLRDHGYDCYYITSDFHHTSKQKFTVDLPHCTQIPTKPYTKNISLARILSHMQFSKDAMEEVRRLKPDLLYVEVPPNSLCMQAAKYKKENPNVTLIFDIFDMWPECFPNNRAKKLLKWPFKIWAWLRNRGLPAADFVFTECNLFRKKLLPFVKEETTKVLHLCRPHVTVTTPVSVTQTERLHLCYLGAINNIIDIPAIAQLIECIQRLRPVTLHIIGDGESRDAFVQAVQATGALVKYYGIIYDAAKRQAIFDKCHFGINIMKDSVCVGLTMKSMDYFAGGLPILNNIDVDTWDLVEQWDCGFNVQRDAVQEVAKAVVSQTPEENTRMRYNTQEIFKKCFSEEVFRRTLTTSLGVDANGTTC
ncbi:MAG: hypothetical protein J6Q42_01480 [Clostridia bacterium]|nr:hypothetical protein [Clostridia bacterium]